MNLNLETIFVLLVYGLLGYVGGWFFKGDADLRSRFGWIGAFLISYVVFFAQVVTTYQIALLQNVWFTGAYASAFLYRFFIHHG